MENPITVTTTTTEKTAQIIPSKPDNWHTLVVVYGTLATGGIFTMFLLLGWKWGLFVAIFAAYEGWTLINQYREDTISEAIWYFSDRPIIALLVGIALATGVWTGFFGEAYQTAMRTLLIGILIGHLFFPRKETKINSSTSTSVKEMEN